MKTLRFLFLLALGFVGAFSQVGQSEARGASGSQQLIVNGIQVYSNKSLTSIVNSRVTFTDGSWADVSTGQVINNGGGCISLRVPCGTGSTPASQKPITIGPKTFMATDLDVENLDANLIVRVGTSKDIKVTVEGPEAWAKSVSTTVEGQTLHIRQPSPSSGGGTFISGGGGISIVKGEGVTIVSSGNVVSNGTVIIGSSQNMKNKVTIEVPKYTHVMVNDVNGSTVIGDTEAPIEATVSGSQDITVGKVTDAVLTVGGSGNITVHAVNGNLTMMVGGSGDLRVQGGNVQTLTVNVGGSGDASFQGTAQTAVVAVGGSGDVKIARVIAKPVVSKGGSGDVTINNWGGGE